MRTSFNSYNVEELIDRNLLFQRKGSILNQQWKAGIYRIFFNFQFAWLFGDNLETVQEAYHFSNGFYSTSVDLHLKHEIHSYRHFCKMRVVKVQTALIKTKVVIFWQKNIKLPMSKLVMFTPIIRLINPGLAAAITIHDETDTELDFRVSDKLNLERIKIWIKLNHIRDTLLKRFETSKDPRNRNSCFNFLIKFWAQFYLWGGGGGRFT